MAAETVVLRLLAEKRDRVGGEELFSNRSYDRVRHLEREGWGT
jgi:hypothetical protein